MADAIVMPSLGMFTAEGEVTDWLKAAGSRVEVGEPVVAVTTEKTTQEIAAPASGVLHPVAAVGALLPIQGLIGYILDEGEVPPAPPVGTSPGPPADPSTVPQPPPTAPTPHAEIPGAQRHTAPPSGEVRATPIARRLAREHGIDLSTLQGSGPSGRIVEADIQTAIARQREPHPTTGGSLGPAPALRMVRERIPLTGVRRTIADRLRSSLATAASVTLTREVDAEAFVLARASLGQRLNGRLTYDALFVKLLGLALRAHIELNAVVEDDAIVVLDDIHVGFAVAIPPGLVVPVVRHVDRRPLAEIAADVRDLGERASASTLRPEEMSGGTATITNLGAHGVDAFSPILNPPQSVILGCGRVVRRPVVYADEVAVRHVCTLSLTFDHRVTDGVPAARLLDQIARSMADDLQLDGLV